jgi:hypothetical protein
MEDGPAFRAGEPAEQRDREPGGRHLRLRRRHALQPRDAQPGLQGIHARRHLPKEKTSTS